MQRPLFSASHSAKLVQQRQAGREHHAHWQKGSDHEAMYWVQTGVTARGEIWGVQSAVGCDTLVDEHDGADDHHTAAGVEVERGPRSHGKGRHADLGNSAVHMAAIRDTALFPPSLSTTTTTMAAKTRWWISLWYVHWIFPLFMFGLSDCLTLGF